MKEASPTYLLCGMKIMRIPANMRITVSPQSMPPQVVKSYLVWNANTVKAKVTTAQIPAAMSTASVWKWAANVPIMKPSHTRYKKYVNISEWVAFFIYMVLYGFLLHRNSAL